jgi:hypothetical protein
MLPATGCVTASVKAVATAASTAFPPSLNMRAPTSDATAFAETTMPFLARTGSEPARTDGVDNTMPMTSAAVVNSRMRPPSAQTHTDSSAPDADRAS